MKPGKDGGDSFRNLFHKKGWALKCDVFVVLETFRFLILRSFGCEFWRSSLSVYQGLFKCET